MFLPVLDCLNKRGMIRCANAKLPLLTLSQNRRPSDVSHQSKHSSTITYSSIGMLDSETICLYKIG
jgi:hypothetical protein